MIMCFCLPTLWVGWAVLVLPGSSCIYIQGLGCLMSEVHWDGWYNWTTLSLWVFTFDESRTDFLKCKWQHSKWEIPNIQIFINPLLMSYFLVSRWQITSKQKRKNIWPSSESRWKEFTQWNRGSCDSPKAINVTINTARGQFVTWPRWIMLKSI